jgi:hypothetical protein
MVTHSLFVPFYVLVGRQHRDGPGHRANAVRTFSGEVRREKVAERCRGQAAAPRFAPPPVGSRSEAPLTRRPARVTRSRLPHSFIKGEERPDMPLLHLGRTGWWKSPPALKYWTPFMTRRGSLPGEGRRRCQSQVEVEQRRPQAAARRPQALHRPPQLAEQPRRRLPRPPSPPCRRPPRPPPPSAVAAAVVVAAAVASHRDGAMVAACGTPCLGGRRGHAQECHHERQNRQSLVHDRSPTKESTCSKGPSLTRLGPPVPA